MDILGVLITCAVATAILDMTDIATVLAGANGGSHRGEVGPGVANSGTF